MGRLGDGFVYGWGGGIIKLGEILNAFAAFLSTQCFAELRVVGLIRQIPVPLPQQSQHPLIIVLVGVDTP